MGIQQAPSATAGGTKVASVLFDGAKETSFGRMRYAQAATGTLADAKGIGAVRLRRKAITSSSFL